MFGCLPSIVYHADLAMIEQTNTDDRVGIFRRSQINYVCASAQCRHVQRKHKRAHVLWILAETPTLRGWTLSWQWHSRSKACSFYIQRRCSALSCVAARTSEIWSISYSRLPIYQMWIDIKQMWIIRALVDLFWDVCNTTEDYCWLFVFVKYRKVQKVVTVGWE